MFNDLLFGDLLCCCLSFGDLLFGDLLFGDFLFHEQLGNLLLCGFMFEDLTDRLLFWFDDLLLTSCSVTHSLGSNEVIRLMKSGLLL